MNALQDCRVLSHQKTITDDVIVKIQSEKICNTVKAGQYVECCFSQPNIIVHPFVFSANRDSAEIELFISAKMMTILGERSVPNSIQISDPQGDYFVLPMPSVKPILIADESGLPAVFFLASELIDNKQQPLVFLSAKKRFPFTLKPSQFVINGLPAGMMATCQLLEDNKIPARLLIEQSEQYIPGCFDGNFNTFFSELSGDEWHMKHVTVFVAGNMQLHELVKNKWHHLQTILTK